MDPKAMGNLRLDRRLLTRRGWIDSKELGKALEALPDVSDKIDDSEEQEAEAGSSEPEP
jgi:hypothetical protein